MVAKPWDIMIISIFLFFMSFMTILSGYLSSLLPVLNWQVMSFQTGFLVYVYSPDLLSSWILSYLLQLPSIPQILVIMIALFVLGVGLFVSGIGFYRQKRWAFYFTGCYAAFNLILPFIPAGLNLNVLYFLSSLTSNLILVQISYYIPLAFGFVILFYLPGSIRQRFEKRNKKQTVTTPSKN